MRSKNAKGMPMATKREKQELMDTLKFTPVQARILLQGYGGECYIGSVSREQYEFFKSKRIDIEQYAANWDDDMFSDIPPEMRPFDPGSPHDCDDLFHGSGATLDSGSYITVQDDETNEDLFETNLDISNLEDQGITVDRGEDFDSSGLEDGAVVFWGGQGEKGCFFDGTVTLRAQFDPAKLRITYGNADDWWIVTGVEYDGEEVEGYDGYSTTGKWAEHKFHIVGDETVYEGVERDEDDEDEDDSDPAAELTKIQVPVLEGEEIWAQEVIDAETVDTEPELWEGIPLTPWWPASKDPVHEGEYDVIIGTWPFPQRAHWDGVLWKQGDQPVIVNTWRGLSQPAE
jgi:hypothetical protein